MDGASVRASMAREQSGPRSGGTSTSRYSPGKITEVAADEHKT